MSSLCYYGCTKSKDKNCTCGYLREEEIIGQIVKLLDTLDMDELGIKHAFNEEIARYNKFRKIALGKSKEKAPETIFDMRAYTVYLLTEGSLAEKRGLLANLKSRLTMKKKVLSLEATHSRRENLSPRKTIQRYDSLLCFPSFVKDMGRAGGSAAAVPRY